MKILSAFLTIGLILVLSLTFLSGISFAAADPAPVISWSKLYPGATAVDGWPYIGIQTSDGGYAIAGRQATGSGNFAFWLIKTDANGNMQWSKTYGGDSYSKVITLIQTQDGGYLIGGDTWAFTGFYDAYLIKTDANGNMQWSKAYGGTSTVLSVLQTQDGGYIWAGGTSSLGAGGGDFWVVKIDNLGNVIWQKTFGGASDEVADKIIQTTDGGYAVFGSTWSYAKSQADWWLVKIDSNGNKQWDKSYNGNGWDDPRAIVQTSDGGYAMFGSTASGTLSADMKMWLIKTDSSGNLLWSKTYGGTGTEQSGWSLVNTGDGGFAFVGRTTSFGAGGNDVWFVKTDSSGVLQFNQTYGGAGDDIGTSLTRTNDGGYAVAGYTNSYGTGSYNCLLIKFSPSYTTTVTHIGSGMVSPNDGQYTVNSLTLTATPASNYAFMCWLQNGTFLSSSNPYSYSPTNSYVITAVFYDPVAKDTPTPMPTPSPTPSSTATPTVKPTTNPSQAPTSDPTANPTQQPARTSTPTPTKDSPSATPTAPEFTPLVILLLFVATLFTAVKFRHRKTVKCT